MIFQQQLPSIARFNPFDGLIKFHRKHGPRCNFKIGIFSPDFKNAARHVIKTGNQQNGRNIFILNPIVNFLCIPDRIFGFISQRDFFLLTPDMSIYFA